MTMSAAGLSEGVPAVTGPDAVLIEPARPDDLDAVLGLERDGFPPEEQWSQDSWRSELESPSLVVLIARQHDQLRGTIALRPGPDVCDLDRIIVARSVRRLGVGRALLTAGLRFAARRGVSKMILEVRGDNAAAIALYRGFGFRQLTVRPDYYGPGQHAMIMSRRVGKDNDE